MVHISKLLYEIDIRRLSNSYSCVIVRLLFEFHFEPIFIITRKGRARISLEVVYGLYIKSEV